MADDLRLVAHATRGDSSCRWSVRGTVDDEGAGAQQMLSFGTHDLPPHAGRVEDLVPLRPHEVVRADTAAVGAGPFRMRGFLFVRGVPSVTSVRAVSRSGHVALELSTTLDPSTRSTYTVACLTPDVPELVTLRAMAGEHLLGERPVVDPRRGAVHARKSCGDDLSWLPS